MALRLDFARRRQRGIITNVTTAVTKRTLPMLVRLSAGLYRSAAQPKTVIPSIASPIVPVLKTLKTRARRFFGVISWREADTSGVTRPELPPITTMRAAAAISDPVQLRPNTARPQTTAAPRIIHRRRHR